MIGNGGAGGGAPGAPSPPAPGLLLGEKMYNALMLKND